MIVLYILGYILLFILMLLAAVILIPVQYVAKGQIYQSACVKGEILLFFKGLQVIFYKEAGKQAEITVRILWFTIHPKVGPSKKKKKDKAKEKKKKSGFKFTKELFEQILKSVGEILIHLKPQVFNMEGSYGFDDPYYTGISSIALYTLPLKQGDFQVDITPVFDEEVIEGRFVIQGRIVLAALLWIALRFLLSRPVRNIFKERKNKAYAS